jgi:methylated-DNA-[protein]-cysteine S-methyltransferase
MKLLLDRIDSPLGLILAVTAEDGRVLALGFADRRAHLLRQLEQRYGRYELGDTPAPNAIATKFARYFAGQFDALNELPTASGGSELQRRVWTALRGIPAGQLISYGELARDLGYTDWRMAVEVGAAVGANPIAIAVPCHRVIGKDGSLKGYAWGLHRKRWLLAHEGAMVRRSATQPCLVS